MSVAQGRRRELAMQNSSGGLFGSDTFKRAHRAPLITYGKAMKPLSLTGRQFSRKDLYDLPSDDDLSNERVSAPQDKTVTHSTFTDDSQLSGKDHLQWDASRSIVRATSRSDVLKTASVGARDAVSGMSKARQMKARSRRYSRSQSTKQADRYRSDHRQTSTTQHVEQFASVKRTTAKQKPQPPRRRRLPVNELLLVQSPPGNDFILDPLGKTPDPEKQDPIRDQSSQRSGEHMSPSAPGLSSEPKLMKTPLTSIRKRLKLSQLKHKALRLKRTAKLAGWPVASHQRAGDGFEAEELDLAPRAHIRKQHSRRKGLNAFLCAKLQLRAGPLPDVVFKAGIHELQVEPSDGPRHVQSPHDTHSPTPEHCRSDADLPKRTLLSQCSRRRVSFCDRDNLIRAQLSSISAPERPDSDIESDSDVDSDEDMADDDEAVEMLIAPLHDLEEGAQRTDRSQPSQQDRPRAGPLALEDRQRQDERAQDIDRAAAVSNNDNAGVTLDFRRPPAPGSLPKRSLKRRRLMEVEEAITDVPDVTLVQLLGNDSALAPAQHAEDIHPHRPRSTFKNNTPAICDSTIMPEFTPANTRRNSRVDGEGARYFAHAAEQLDLSGTRSHRIVPRRRSSYFNEPYVQVGKFVGPESPPDSTHYIYSSQLNPLRQSMDAVWVPKKMPAEPRDLKTLTRSVSRKHGTMSQAVRRRPSLLFRSPTKVR